MDRGCKLLYRVEATAPVYARALVVSMMISALPVGDARAHIRLALVELVGPRILHARMYRPIILSLKLMRALRHSYLFGRMVERSPRSVLVNWISNYPVFERYIRSYTLYCYNNIERIEARLAESCPWILQAMADYAACGRLMSRVWAHVPI